MASSKNEHIKNDGVQKLTHVDTPFVQVSDNIDSRQISHLILIAYLRYIAPSLPAESNPLNNIPNEIIKLFALYLGNYYSTRCKHTWRITDKSLIKQILNAETFDHFVHKFDYGPLKWIIQLYPSGQSWNCQGICQPFLELLNMPSNLREITVLLTIKSMETYSCMTCIKTYYHHTRSYGLPNGALSLKELKEGKFKELNFMIELNILDIKAFASDNVRQNIVRLYKYYPKLKRSSEITWKLNKDKDELKYIREMSGDPQYGKRIQSRVYDDMWTLFICPIGGSNKNRGICLIGLGLCGLPPEISMIKIKWAMAIMENERIKIKTSKLSYGKPGKTLKKVIFFVESCCFRAESCLPTWKDVQKLLFLCRKLSFYAESLQKRTFFYNSFYKTFYTEGKLSRAESSLQNQDV